MKIIGTRGSQLALWQAHHVQDLLQAAGIDTEIKIIKTQGDIIQNVSFNKMEGKGFFTKELESELLSESIDIAVHSFKDLETSMPQGLTIAAISERAAPEDVLLIHPDSYVEGGVLSTADNAVIGTSSARRMAQMERLKPECQVKALRGNVPTRIKKLLTDDFDAILLAKAGLDRLEIDLAGVHVEVLSPSIFVPAPAQGALGIQMRSSDQDIDSVKDALHHPDSAQCVEAERSVLAHINGGCQMPFGAHCNRQMSGFEMKIFHKNHIAQIQAPNVANLVELAKQHVDQA
ncbi:MAG: hydroxymethylbilane synthase [Flavobacteriales bacterium]|nr:hydroxymethylbilane synthase [Flavobacteriales bacterium]